MLYILIILVFGVIMYKNKDNYIVHIILSILMYGLYIFLWFIPSIENSSYDENKHHTDSALGVAIMFIFSMPIYLIVHTLFIWYSKKKQLRNIYTIFI